METVVKQLQLALNRFKARMADGLSWSEIAASFLDFVRLASSIVRELPESGEAKQALVVEWSLKAFDLAVTAITASFSAWWLIPLFAGARMLLVQFLPGIVHWVYERLVKEVEIPE